MKSCILIAILSFTIISTGWCANKLSVKGMKCEDRDNPLGIDVKSPHLSWKLHSEESNLLQTAYEIRVSVNADDMASSVSQVWHSGKVDSDRSLYIPYQGHALKSKQRYYWQVRVWDNKGNRSAWSDVGYWETGLQSNNWKASWIESSSSSLNQEGVLNFRKAFRLKGKVKEARLYMTSHGIYEAQMNGQPVSDHLFAPGWTSYHKRLQYQVYDVTEYLKEEENLISVMVGEGWYKGPLLGVHGFYGNNLGLLSQLEITYLNGDQEVILTDETWQTSWDGPVVRSGLYSGEVYDSRKLFNDVGSSWTNAVLSEKQDYHQLVASYGNPVRRQDTLLPKKVLSSPIGEKIIDFGQNLVGRVRFQVKGKAGDSVVISHAEVLDKNGNFYTANLRKAAQKIVYYLNDQAEQYYEPHFTFQGFRYIKIEGNKELINENNIEAVVIHSDLESTGKFTTSNPLLNQLQSNIIWGQKGNFVDIPTDCPQRDERLGWTGDAQVFSNTAMFNMDVRAFFTKWLRDLRAEQLENGGVSGIVPNIWGQGERDIGQAGWADAVTIIPWNFYQIYGNKQILEENYEAMKKWASYIQSKSTGYLWDQSWHHGDWLSYMPKDVWDRDPAYTDKTLIAQAFYANTVQIIINTATVLGKTEDENRYSSLLKEIKMTFAREFMTPTGALMSNTQTAYVLALHFDLLPEEYRQKAADRLATIIKQYENHISTGFLGTPYICHVLSRYGYQDLAYSLLMQETYPSWLYPVKMGATTIWERWDGIQSDGSFQDVNMNSFNHYAYGAIGDWMYQNIGGIRKKMEGYKEFIIAPQPGGGLAHAEAELETGYGKIVSSWKIHDRMIDINVEIPPNTTAEIHFPHSDTVHKVGSGQYHFSNTFEKLTNK